MEACLTYDQAMQEAARCLLCHDAPCSKECPATTDPGGFIRKLRFRNLKGAVALVKENNVLAGTCGVVCPTCELCAKGCSAAGLGEPIRISQLQRFLVEYGWDIGFDPFARLAKPKPGRGARVAVVGSGPSGLTCAAELAKFGFEVVVFERRSKPGGMLQWAIPEHRLSRSFFDREIGDVLSLGVEIRCDAGVETQKDLDRLLRKDFQAAYVATGAAEGVELDVPQREAAGAFDALTFLERAKHDARRFATAIKGRSVAVIGGGDTAMDAASAAAAAGAREVSVVYRRTWREMPGAPDEKARALGDGVNFVFLAQPVDYLVERRKVAGLRLVRNRLGARDASGRPKPLPVPGTEHDLPADVVVVAVGQRPGRAVKAFTGLESDDRNRLVVGKDLAVAGAKRVWAGGDAVRGASLVANAVGDGKRAAEAIARALGKGK